MRVVENSDKELVADIREAIKEKDGHCCCSLFPTPENVCMCQEFRDQIKQGRLGKCHCGLYEVVE